MPVFSYSARDQSGQQTSGNLEADSPSSAAALLREQGLWITDLKQSGRSAAPAGVVPSGPVDTSVARRMVSPVPRPALSLLYRQLHTLLNSGVGIFAAFEMLCQPGHTPNARLRSVVTEIAPSVLRGGRISGAMARFPWLFDRMQVRMVEAGEEGGFLPDVFRRLADYLERDHQVRQSIKQKTLYPKLVLGLLLFVLPVRVPLTLGTYLAELTRLLLWVGGVGLFLWVVCRFLFSTSAGRDLYDRIKLALPVIGGLVRKMTVARFARTLAALYSSGVPVASALQMAGESCGNHALERLTANIVPAVSKGNSIALSMEATRFFPTMFTGMVSTGETTGNLDQMLEKAADFYEEEAIHATTQLVVILGVAALLFAAIMVLMKLLSFYAGMIGGIMPSEG